MNNFFTIYMIFSFILIVLSIWLAIRNYQVHEYRMDILKLIGEHGREDAVRNLPWKWRFEYFETVPYWKMLLFFWKPLDSFYKDKRFIEKQ